MLLLFLLLHSRYADILVHRLLAAALEHEAKPQAARVRIPHDELRLMARQCNRRKQYADQASDDCDYLFLCLFMRQLSPPAQMEAVVMDVNPDKSFVVLLLLPLDMEEMLMLRDVKAEEQWDDAGRALTLSWPSVPTLPKVTLQTLTRIRVTVGVNSDRNRTLELRLQLMLQGRSLDEWFEEAKRPPPKLATVIQQ